MRLSQSKKMRRMLRISTLLGFLKAPVPPSVSIFVVRKSFVLQHRPVNTQHGGKLLISIQKKNQR